MKVSETVRIVPVPEDEPMRPTQTNIYIVGQPGGQVLTIDSGEAIDKFWWMLRGYLAAIDQSEIGLAAISHHHFDHSGNLKNVSEHLKAEVAVPANGVKLLRGRLPKEGVRTFVDGQTLNLDGGVRIQVIATPGHSASIRSATTSRRTASSSPATRSWATPPRWWATSTATWPRCGGCWSCPTSRCCAPGHGPLIRDTDDLKARDRLEMYVAHRQMRENQVLEQLEGGEPKTSWEIMEAIYGDTIDKRLRRAADGNVQAHLKSMVRSGVVRQSRGVRRTQRTSTVERDRGKQRERDAVIRKAKRFERDKQRRQIARQESAPTEVWSRAPSYQLRSKS